MSRVFVVQETNRVVNGRLIPTFDLSQAKSFGEVVVLIPARAKAPSSVRVDFHDLIRKGLTNFCDDDYLLPIGDPMFIAEAGACAADANGGRFRVLRHLRHEHRYEPETVIAWEDQP